MVLPELNTRTPATVQLLPQFGQDGAPCIAVVIKQRFSVVRIGHVRREGGAQVRRVDELWEPEAEQSSIRRPADVGLRKPSTDVVVAGSAMAVHGEPTKVLDVSVRVGPVGKRLRVFGTRVWYPGVVGLSLTAPQPFQEVPLRWELAYGGLDTSNPRKLAHEPRNPLGRGVVADADSLKHKPAPQIEDPSDLISSVRSRPTPAGVGAIGPQFEPRLRLAGTYDDRWQKERMPLPPLDFDERYRNVAAPGLVCPSYLTGGELVEVEGMSESGQLRFELPKLFFGVVAVTAQGDVEHRPVLDTVLLEPNERRFELTWRSVVPVPKRARELSAINVFEKERLS
ncbi:DUF2169 domain-containing protein [Myxococcus sp. K38C18041901]|uniref:DUF2169 family type VI secretion system accessory protein n=1 Tax=Myxococcus guangdongensis TaxID=2906760 RepID=UPI0020A821FD|nr:DUF2169 domain-containing protein [Myxococcus guangdongensis]MCP3065272.1 DUF2169 domain-containing protein [Myxococcus guangdongensis]